ncbi:hypothetical protein C0214_23770 [Methylobacterium sp. DM1]|nr:hypothetical protein C0214_23770 [Methylobacterium sp. DM1]
MIRPPLDRSGERTSPRGARATAESAIPKGSIGLGMRRRHRATVQRQRPDSVSGTAYGVRGRSCRRGRAAAATTVRK